MCYNVVTNIGKMAVARIILWDSPSRQKQNGTYPVCLRLTHDRKRKYFSLGKDALPKQWNPETCRFRKNYPNHNAENELLLSCEAKANQIIRNFAIDDKPFSLEAFGEQFLKKEKIKYLQPFFQKVIDQFFQAGKLGTGTINKSTLNIILEFAASLGSDPGKLKLSAINYKFLIDLEHWLRTERKCKDTSIGVYMRTFRAVINRAIREGLLKKDNYPFDEYKLSERLNVQIAKRAIDKDKMKEIEALELEEGSKEHFAQNILLFSYYTRGMNFVDIANLTKDNIMGERLIYIRQKTGKPFNLKLPAKALEIINYYRESENGNGGFIFPIFDNEIHKEPMQKFHRHRTVLKEVNKSLKTIAELVGMEGLKLTTYVSRHTYATTLKKSGVDISKISEALGHGSEKVTQAYLKSFENEELDKIDENIL